MSTARGHGLGKLILCGEHAVVYGHPALAFAVDRRTEVVLEQAPGPRVVDAPELADPRLDAALDTLLPGTGLRVQIRSDLPIGRGMGSSAALAVALVRARAALEGRRLGPNEVFESAMPVEQVFHGNPSGLDVAVAARGGFLLYRRGPPVEIQSIPAQVPWRVVVLDTEIAGDTAALVAGVAAQRPDIDPKLERIGDLVDAALECLQDPEALSEILNENHAILQDIGVSNDVVDTLVQRALASGASAAKLSGAGGGGVVLALVDDPNPVLQMAARYGTPAFCCGIGSS